MTASYADFTWVAIPELKRLADSEGLWRYYRDTEVYLESATRSGTVRPVDSEGSQRPPFGALHIISATQPGETPGTKDSERRITVLQQELRTAGLMSIRAVGSSIHGGYSEESRAIRGLDDDRARELGCRFGQVAIFSWHGPHWSLLACATNRETLRAWQWTDDMRGGRAVSSDS
jgi:hypothetical protein